MSGTANARRRLNLDGRSVFAEVPTARMRRRAGVYRSPTAGYPSHPTPLPRPTAICRLGVFSLASQVHHARLDRNFYRRPPTRKRPTHRCVGSSCQSGHSARNAGQLPDESYRSCQCRGDARTENSHAIVFGSSPQECESKDCRSKGYRQQVRHQLCDCDGERSGDYRQRSSFIGSLVAVRIGNRTASHRTGGRYRC